MKDNRILEIAESIMQLLRADYPGKGALGWMWTTQDLENIDEIYFANEAFVYHPAGTGPLNASDEKLLFNELQRLVSVELALQENSLEYDATTWVEWMRTGEAMLVDDGHPLTRRLITRVGSLIAGSKHSGADKRFQVQSS